MASPTPDAKVEAQLAAAESELRAALLRLLPHAVSRAVDYFSNTAFSQPQSSTRPRNADAEALLATAQRCLALRESLSLAAEGSLAHAYLSACRELASTDPHRRGPRRLAESLLAEAERSGV